jgi:hypothetical protein
MAEYHLDADTLTVQGPLTVRDEQEFPQVVP